MHRMYVQICYQISCRYYIDILQKTMKTVDRIQKNHRMSVLQIIKTTDPLEFIYISLNSTRHSDIDVNDGMIG